MESGDDRSHRGRGDGFRLIPGMESVVATVSGYHGTERFKLIKLIALTGANYVGAMTKSTTHLVCWQFEGKKYNLARNVGAHIISHRWFEDCLKERKRLPECSYTTQSGQEAGPITWEVPAISDSYAKGKSIISIKPNVLSDRYNSLNGSRAADDDASYLNWPESPLLYKDESNSFQNFCSSSKKRKTIFKSNRDDFACVPTRRSDRLRKKEYGDLLKYFVRGQKQGASVKKCSKSSEFIDSDSVCQNSSRSMLEPDDVEEHCSDEISGVRNASSDNRNSSDNEHCKDKTAQRCTSKNGQNDNEHHKEDDDLYKFDAYKQELSCVICWTEFCAERAVLPCGHRFCYSCIQGWADCMASSGKASTCPLCKASFKNIRKIEDASIDQKIYSQTIPCASSITDSFILLDEGNDNYGTCKPFDSLCHECRNHEPEELLVCCHICQSQWVHSYCLDPPVFPWTCVHCRDLRALYRHFR